ncbi:BT_3928 family protein [Reichenbachiella versicolor]|uniref:BT_3928 family protein n=1 Tax=Reichenbachiella versicolor TaxID=1821036 RepID=UPI000D6E9F75|nr:BT_3928 family protein [Reichenbachiella versicolor]
MKYLSAIIRYLVGGLFIFSGLIKVNDPIGTAIKMEEYFEVFATNFSELFHYLIPLALPISIIFVVLEVVLGVALILGYKQNATLYSILGLCVFFTFLTGYSAITNSVTDCGCFGDAIKLTPWQSFYKDIVLVVLLLVLMFLEHDVQSKKFEKISHYIVISSTIISFFLCYWMIEHLPFLDFRAYKIGNHIPTEMQPSAPYIYEFVMTKDGKEYKFKEYPTDTSYKYVAMNHLNPEAAPKITDFGIWNDEGDFTESVFEGRKLYVILYDVSKADLSHLDDIKKLTEELRGQVEVNVLTASSADFYAKFSQENDFNLPFYYTDATVLKTIARSNPGLWLLNEGTVVGKWHHNDVPFASTVLDLL